MVNRTLENCRNLAREAVRRALQSHRPFSAETKNKLVLGEGIEGGRAYFELYIPGERPIDAIVLVQAEVNISSGEVKVDVFPERWLDSI